jgi:hypothetical protein
MTALVLISKLKHTNTAAHLVALQEQSHTNGIKILHSVERYKLHY